MTRKEALLEVEFLKEFIRLRMRVDKLTQALIQARDAHAGYLEEHWNAFYESIDEALEDA